MFLKKKFQSRRLARTRDLQLVSNNVGGNECARVIKTTREPITGGILAAVTVCAVVVQLKAVPNKSKEKPNRYLYVHTRTRVSRTNVEGELKKKERKKPQLEQNEIPNAPGMKKAEQKKNKNEKPSSSSALPPSVCIFLSVPKRISLHVSQIEF